MTKVKSKLLKSPLILGMPAALVVAVLGLFQSAYRNTDNYIMAMITSGLMNGDTLNPYLNPLVSQIIAGLNRLIPTADWFTILGRVFLTLGAWWVGILLARRFGGNRRLILYEVIIASVCLGCSLYNINYTVQAAAFTFIGVLTLQLKLYDGGARGDVAVGTFFFGFGVCWRLEGGLLTIPYILLVAVVNLIFQKSKRSLRQVMLTLAPAAVVLVLLSGYRAAIFSIPRYAGNLQYNQARVAVVDYPLKDWEQVKDELSTMGITQNDYESVHYLMLADTDRIDAEYMEKIAEAASTSEYPLTLRGIVDAAWNAVKIVLGSKESLYLGAIIFLGILSILISKPSIEQVIILILSSLGTAVICFYFSWRGRLPERVVESVLFALASLIISENVEISLRKVKNKSSWLEKGLQYAALVVAICGGVVGYWRSPRGMPQNLFTITVNADSGAWQDTTSSNEIYLWGGEYWYKEWWEQGKMTDTVFFAHNVPCGEWYYGQTGFQKHLQSIGIPNPMKALLSRPETYLIAEETEMEYVLTYLKEHFDSSVQAKQVSVLYDQPVWQFEASANGSN